MNQTPLPHSSRRSKALAATALCVVLAGTGAFFVTRPHPTDKPQIQPVSTQPVVVTPELLKSRPVRTISVTPTDPVLGQIYQAFENGPLWTGNKDAEARAKALTRQLPDLESQGIDASGLKAALESLASAAPDDLAAADMRVTKLTLAAMQAVRVGTVPMSALQSHWKIPAEQFDAAPALVSTVSTDKLPSLFAGLAPVDPAYGKLVKALAEYRTRTAAGWATIPGDKELMLDGKDPRAELLRERLRAEGYDVDDLAAAVAAFQARHGLEPDGRVGKSTLAELNVTAEQRVQQILANLERWRHLPRLQADTYVAVNTADATVRVIRDGEVVATHRAITGAPWHATPELVSNISAVTFNPPWEIPESIARNEILPKLKQDPTYLANNRMTVVNGSESDPHGYYMNWAQYEDSAPFHFRQRPGAGNSLGYLKFEMQNPWNIYLHDTSSRELFNKPERHLSHGCVRVENPRELAATLLADGEWERDDIDSAIATGRTSRTAIKPTIPVQVLYWTALVDDRGELNFRPDVYGRDASIVAALSANKR